MKGRKSKSNQGRIKLRSFIACLTAVSVLMGSTSFVMAGASDPVYICGETEHTHGASCYGDQLTCTTPEKLVYTCGQVVNGDGTVTYGEKTEHAHNLANCYTLTCTTPVGHVHSDAAACYSETETQKNWTCTEAVHDHTSGCDYTACPEEHDHVNECCTVPVHEHAEGTCYTVGPKLVCTVPVNHEHAQATCYTQTCTRDVHAHVDSCTIADPTDPVNGHKHGDACYAKNVLLCTKVEHVHTDACIQPEEVTELLADLDKLNALGLAMQELEDAYDDAAEAVADIQEEKADALEAAETDEAKAEIENAYAEPLRAAAKALEDAEDALEAKTAAFEEARAAAIAVYNQWSEEHPEYQTLMAERYAKYKKLMIEGVVFGEDAGGSGSTGGSGSAGDDEVNANGTTNDSENIVMNLFNYDDSIVNKYNTNACVLDFYDYGGGNAVDTEGHNTRSFGGTVCGYTVNPALSSDGYPVTSKGDLAGLFNGAKASEKYYGVTGLLKQEGTHYFYDSRNNAAMFNESSKTFTVFNDEDGSNYTVVPKGTGKYSRPNKDDKPYTSGNFLPFNDPTNVWVKETDDEGNVIKTYSKPYELKENNDMWFGMTMEFDFRMPEDGMLAAGQPMKFSFTGDDDVLVYIDDMLVIDLKGCHEAATGIIDFNSGLVQTWDEYHDPATANPDGEFNMYTKYATAYAADLTTGEDGKTRFADYTTHTLKFFYLERGGMYSCCALDFNMPTIPKHSLTVKKVVEADGVLGADAQEYKFRVVKADESGNATNELFVKNTEITIKETDGDTRNVVVGKDGYFTLKHGEEALITEMNAKGGVKDKYIVQEVLPKAFSDGFNVYTPTAIGGTIRTGAINKDFNGLSTSPILNQKSRGVQFNNKVVTDKLGVLEITKDARDNLTGSFPIEVLFGDMYGTNEPSVPLAKDTEYTVTKADGTTETKEVKVAGIIELADGDTARIEGILPGTRYLISEPEAEKGGYTPVFAEGYGATGAVPVKGVDEDGKEKIAKVSIVNRVTKFGLGIPLTKTVNGMPKYVAFEDEFEFVAELVSYETEPQNGFGAIFEKLQFLAKYRNNVAAIDKTTSIEVNNGITATNSVGAASATEEGTLQLKFDLDTPNGVYTYKVKEVAKDGYAANRQEFTVKVKVDQNEDGTDRAVIVDAKGNPVKEAPTLAFVNDRNENKLDVTVNKVWGTTENSKIQPTDSVTVKLMVDGEAEARATATLSEANDWTATWEDVVADTETWTVVETPVPDKYNVSYDYDYTATTAAVTVTNTPKGTTGGGGGDPDYGSLEISKITRGDTTFTANDVFNMAVTLDGAPIPEGTSYKLNDVVVEGGVDGTEGIIPMHVGDVVLIEGILKGTDYTVREVVPADADFYATYAGPADATVTENGVAGAIAASTVHGVDVKNHSNEFGLSFNLLKQVFGLNPGEAYTFNFDIELFSYRDEAGNPVNNIEDPNKAEKSKSITVTVPAAEAPEGDEATPAVAVETVPEGTGQFALNFDADTPSGTYVYVVTEKAGYDLVKFKENKQKFAVTVVVDQDAEQRAVITSVKNEKGDELGTTAPLTFVNMTRDAAPKQVVSVVKEWKNDDTLRPAVTVELTVTLNGVESKETVELNAANGWRYTWNLDTDATWSVKEVGVKDHSTTDGKTWTMANTKAYYTTTTSEAKDVTVNGVDMKEVTITNTRNVPGGGGGGHDPKDPPKEEPPTPNNPTPEDPGDVLGENEELLDIGEDGTPLGDKDLEDPLVAGDEEEVSLIAATGDNKIIVVAAAGMVAAIAGILALRKKKED